MLVDESSWVDRRIESIDLLARGRVRRETTIDLTVPVLDWPDDQVIIPLLLLRKGAVVDLAVSDEWAQPLVVLTRTENGLVAWEALRTLARQRVPTLDPSVVSDLRDLAGVPRSSTTIGSDRLHARSLRAAERFRSAEPLIDTFLRHNPTAIGHSMQAVIQRELLWREGTAFRWLATELADQFVLLVQVVSSPGDRREIKISYEHGPGTTDPVHLRSTKVRQALGLTGYERVLRTPQAFDARSYHVELRMPPGLVVFEAELVIGEESTQKTERLDRSERTDRVQLLAPRIRQNLGRFALVRLVIGLDYDGFLQIALGISLLTSLILAGGAVLHGVFGTPVRPDATTALIVVLPAVFATFLVPSEQRLVRQMFSGLRLAVLVSALTSFLAGADLAVELSSRARFDAWIGLAVASVVITALLARAEAIAWKNRQVNR